MKKIALIFLLIGVILLADPKLGNNAKVIVVDNTPISGKSCENTSNPYLTIQDAVNAAHNGDTIKICKGDYNEAVTINGIDDLTITNGADASTPSDINWYSSGYTLFVKGATKSLTLQNLKISQTTNNPNYQAIRVYSAKDKITLQNLIVDTSNGASSIYIANNVNNNLEGKFKKLTIISKGEGIYIEKGSKQEFDDLNVTLTNTSANYFGIYMGNNVKNENHSFSNLTFTLKSDSAIKINHGKDMKFENITIKATSYTDNTEAISLQNNLSNDAKLTFKDITIELNAGVGINIKKAKDTKFENITIKDSSQWAIWLRDNVVGKPEFKNITIKAKKEGGIKIQKGKDAKFDTLDIAGIDGNGFVIWLTQNVTGSHEFKNLTTSTHAQGILVQKANKLDFDNVTIQGDGNSPNYYGIRTTQNVTGDIKITNCDISVSGKALYIEKGKPDIKDSRFESSLEEKVLHFLSNTNEIKLEKSCIYKDNSGGNAYGLYIQNSKSNAKIKENCFFGSPLQNLAYADKNGNEVDKNYWEGLSANSYNYNNIIDANPSATCQSSCAGGSSIPQPIIDYRMDECSWDGDPNSYEVKNSGSLGDDANATALNDANVTDGVINNAGDFDGKYIQLKNNQDIGDKWTSTFWVKFPLVGSNDQFAVNLGTRHKPHYYKVYVIASVKGDGDLGLFLKDQGGDYRFGVYDNKRKFKSKDIPDLSDGWHFFAMVSDKKKTHLYIDGQEQDYKVDLATSGDLKFVGTSTDYSDRKTIGSDMDEFKIFDKILTKEQIKTIYNNESSAKNYDGSTREPPNCSGENNQTKAFKFDAWDTFRDINDRNISTKIAGKKFSLTIASLDENATALEDFNGTVCAKVDSNISKLWFHNESTKIADFTVDKALKDVRVELSWKKDVYINCPLLLDDNETNSTDNFAIRPKSFSMTLPTSAFAGEDFNISFNALDDKDINTTNYNETKGVSFVVEANETKAGCITGDFNLSSFSFVDGEKESVSANYSEVGDVNITIKEKKGSEFAKVDADDTNESDRLITSSTKTLLVKPYEINVTDASLLTSTQKEWLYMADNINDMNVTLKVSLAAFNKLKANVKNFSSTCYAKDINVTFYYDVDRSDEANLTLSGDLTSSDVNISDINKTLKVPKSLFVNGEANSSYAFGIDRSYNAPKSPIKVTLKDINVTTQNASKRVNGKVRDDNVSFYYGRVVANDIATTQKSTNAFIYVDIYSKNSIQGWFEDEIDWYRNRLDSVVTTKSDIEIIPRSDMILDSSDKPNVTVSNITDAQNGKISFDINNTKDSYDSAILHIKIPSWLWSNSYKEYNDTTGSNCSSHPCINYKLMLKSGANDIQSGTFTGSDIGHDQNKTLKRVGVKVYR